MNAPTAAPLHVVARFLDGSVLKGTTRDFAPNRTEFHVIPDGAGQAIKVQHAALKAVFFVKSLTGNKEHVEAQDLENARGQGRRVQVTFKDGEIVSGFTVGYTPDRPGFFVVPIDPRSNNLRVFVVNASVARVDFLAARPIAAAGGGRA